MKVLESLSELRSWRRGLDSDDLGFVPTMGALHEGHDRLVERAVEESSHTIVSIFVNPKQFGAGEDFDVYPRTREADRKRLAGLGVDAVWFGRTEELYPAQFATQVELPSLSTTLCGPTRPGHFAGVALIVLKLFNLVQPRRAYFGRKDYQQLVMVDRMVRDLNLDIEIRSLGIVREEDGLALSSRNRRLTAGGREVASVLFLSLSQARELYTNGCREAAKIVLEAVHRLREERRIKIEYVELVDAQTLEELRLTIDRPAVLAAAIWIDRVRLIDNIELEPSPGVSH